MQINETTKQTDWTIWSGIVLNGFTLGSNFNETYNANIEVKEIIIRKVVDSSGDESTIYGYLKQKYGL